MARQAQGHRVFWSRGWAYVYFTHAKKSYRIALGTKDPGEAAKRAAKEYSDVVRGRKVVRPGSRSLLDLDELLASWLDESKGALDPKTLETYEIYARKFVAHFASFDAVTEPSIGDYTRARLREVAASTVRKERSGLSSFLSWCLEKRFLTELPAFPPLPKKATGTRSGAQRAAPVDVTPEEARAIIAKLPEQSKRLGDRKWPVRARYVVAYETGLRPETLATLSVPEHYRKGRKTLLIAAENDKARYEREVPLSALAREALDAVAPKAGLVFGRHNFDKALKRAARSVLGEDRGKDFASYDFRHGRATDLLELSGSLGGVAYVLGHKRLTTTNRYLRGTFRAGEEAMRRADSFRIPSADGSRKKKRRVTDGD